MRIAVLSDIHGNWTALEAVIADLRTTAPDVVLHGGDLADSGSSPVEVLDCVRDLGWRGVMGNTDEMLVRPESLEEFASRSKAPPALWDAIRAIASATREALGPERLAWLDEHGAGMNAGDAGDIVLLHASPRSCWHAPSIDAPEEELAATYDLGKAIVVYGHTHIPGIRRLRTEFPRLVVNTGSVGLPYDGDPRASYLLSDDGDPAILRVEYDVERELRRLATCGRPGAEWTAKMLKASAPTMP